MSHETDIEQAEIRALSDALDWVGKAVLEVGTGDGRLARRIEDLGSRVTGVDPDVSLVKNAVESPGKPNPSPIAYCIGDGCMLPFRHGTFDVVVFGWSL